MTNLCGMSCAGVDRAHDATMSDNRMMGGPFIGVDGATENDMLAGLDPGIVKLVAWLRGHGFNTTDSGDGQAKFADGFTEDDGVCPFAHATMVMHPSSLVPEADRLAQLLLEEHGIMVEPLGPEEGDEDPPRIDASYCPAMRSAMMILINVDDAMLNTTGDVVHR